MKLNKICLTIIMILAVFFISSCSKASYDNIKLYKNGSEITLTKDNINKINEYLKNEKLIKTENESTIENIYNIIFDNKELWFGNNSNEAFFKNNDTFEDYNTVISDDLINYIINLEG